MDWLDEWRHEWRCPSCGAHTRARMADHGDGVAAMKKRLKRLAEEWEAQMPLTATNEMAAAARAILRECSASVRKLIEEMEGGHDSTPPDRPAR